MYPLRENKNNYFKVKYSFMVFALFLSACATSQKGKIFESMAIGSSLGALYGYSKEDYKQENALMYGALIGLIATSIAVVNDSTEEEMNKKLKAFSELNSSYGTKDTPRTNYSYKDTIIFQGSSIQKAEKLPDHLKNILSQGNVIGFKTDEWIDYGNNRAGHIDEVWEFTLPEFKLKTN